MSPASDPFAPLDASATAQDLAQLAAARPDLRVAIAWHPNAYPDLLDWLDAYGGPAASQAVDARRSRRGPEPEQEPALGMASTPAAVPAASRPAFLTSRAAGVVGIAVLIVGIIVSFILGSSQGSGGPGGTRNPANTAQIQDFDIAATPSFVDGIRLAWQLNIDDLQPTGEEPALYGVADYGDFWLISTSEVTGDLAHGGRATAVDADTGTTLWSVPDGASERECAKQLVAGRLICRHDVDQKSLIESIDPTSGSISIEPDPGFPVGAVLALDDSYLVVGAQQDGANVRIARIAPGAGPQWKSEIAGWCTDPGDYGQTSVAMSRTDSYLAVDVDYCLGVIIDPGTGRVSDSFGAANLVALNGAFAADRSFCQSGGSSCAGGSALREVSDVLLPDGSRLPLRRSESDAYARSGSEAALQVQPASWFLDEGDDCSLGAVVNAASGKNMWSEIDGRGAGSAVQVGEGSAARPAFVLASAAGSVALTVLDPATGKPVWERTISPPLRFEDSACIAWTLAPDPQTILVVDEAGLNAFSASDGELRWSGVNHFGTGESGSWGWRVIPGPNGASVLERGEGVIARLVPASAATRVDSMPISLPDCPRGWTPVSWSTWDGGHTLVCRTAAKGTFYLEYSDHGSTYRADVGTGTATGWQVEYPGGPALSVAFSGAVIQATQNGVPTVRYPDVAWRGAPVSAFTKAPASLPGCPSGSWPLSLSTWDGGWLLVCGTTADAPSSMVFTDGARTVSADTVSYTPGAYCGQAADMKVCAYQTPALVSEMSQGALAIQHSVTQNWFAGSGSGGAGEGTGSYGVEVPDVDASDQLRYLDQILAKSKAARQTLSPSISDVRSCRRVSSAIKRIDAVTANRDELLTALDSAPVDALPEGSRLVADLQNVLALSRDTDRAYAEWARAEQENGCSGGTKSSLWATAQAADKAVDGPKNAFVSYWNSVIAGAYSVRKLTNSDV